MRLLSIILLSVMSFQADAQANLDSLWSVWQNENQQDSVRLKALFYYTKDGFVRNQPDSAFSLGKIMFEFAERKSDDKGMAEAQNIQGLAQSRMGKLDAAMRHYEECLAIREKIDDKVGVTLVLNNIANAYKNKGDYEKSLEVHEKNLELKKALGGEKNIGSTLFNMANVYSRLGEQEKALQYYERSLEIDQRHEDKNGVATVLNSMGIVYYRQGNIALAVEQWTKSLSVKEQLGDKKGAASALNNIGVVYNNQGDNEKSLEYHQRALRIRREIQDKRGVASSLHNMGVIYNLQKQIEKSLEVNRESLKLKEEMGNKPGIAFSYNNIGEAHRISGNYPEAIISHEKALSIREEIGDKHVGSSLSNLGLTYLNMGDYDNAILYSKLAVDQANEVESAINIRDASKQLYKAYSAIGQKDKALEYYELHITMRDSIDSEDNQREVLRQEYKYSYEKEALTDSLEFAKKEAVMEERSEKQRIGLFAAGSGLLLLLALAWAIYSGKKKSDELLLNILPAETAEELKAKGHADAKLIEDVTVLFTDFKGFTAMAEQLSAKELVDDLNVCFSEFDRIMEKYGIEKIKTIGDAYMAAGGLPTPSPDHAQKVVKAALEMRDFVEGGKQRKIEAGLPYFEIRIGVHTGPVVAGIVGIKKFQYDIWGDTVNTASRMESSGEVGKVNVSETTYELVKDDFLTMPRGEIEAKGKGKVKMFFVERG